MSRLAAWIEGFALSVGGPGLFLIAFLDSSFVSLPQINDLLVIMMVIQRKELMLYYAGMATLGSVVGCLVMYYIGRKGGEAVLRRRFKAGNVDRALGAFRRYGLLAVLVPAILPPPAPFKIFVLLAGVARVRPLSFVSAVATGRGFRYVGEGLLAVWYGDQAMAYLDTHGRDLSIGVAVAVALGGLAYAVWHRRGRRGTAPTDPPDRPDGSDKPIGQTTTPDDGEDRL